jgi:hypothetical protein
MGYNFLRVACNWEMDLFTSFFNLLYSVKLRRGEEDKFCWVLINRGCLMLDHITIFLFLMIVVLFFGRVFGRIRFS